ncbi:MAG: type II toxin-antitoxin system RelE/ParE family toxin [Bacteroidetes bacterium]|nr:type II toxin-antitoxin system RelE/ParE family toxin [Bacteroidota bacterium]
MEVVWSKKAQQTYLKTVQYILENWTFKEAVKFEKAVFSLLNSIALNNQLCPPSNKSKHRRCVVGKQTSVVYKIKSNKISVVAFIDNRANHGY